MTTNQSRLVLSRLECDAVRFKNIARLSIPWRCTDELLDISKGNGSERRSNANDLPSDGIGRQIRLQSRCVEVLRHHPPEDDDEDENPPLTQHDVAKRGRPRYEPTRRQSYNAAERMTPLGSIT